MLEGDHHREPHVVAQIAAISGFGLPGESISTGSTSSVGRRAIRSCADGRCTVVAIRSNQPSSASRWVSRPRARWHARSLAEVIGVEREPVMRSKAPDSAFAGVLSCERAAEGMCSATSWTVTKGNDRGGPRVRCARQVSPASLGHVQLLQWRCGRSIPGCGRKQRVGTC
jgi:hypothetical protein